MCICPDCTAEREKFMVPSELLKKRLESNYEEDNSLDENNKKNIMNKKILLFL